MQLYCYDLPKLCVLWGSTHDTISYLDVWVVSGIEFLWEYPAIFLKTVCLHMTSFWWPPLRRWHCCGHNKLLRNYHDRFLGGRQKVCLDPRSRTAEQHPDLWGCQACKIKTIHMTWSCLGFFLLSCCHLNKKQKPIKSSVRNNLSKIKAKITLYMTFFAAL